MSMKYQIILHSENILTQEINLVKIIRVISTFRNLSNIMIAYKKYSSKSSV